MEIRPVEVAILTDPGGARAALSAISPPSQLTVAILADPEGPAAMVVQ
jgi:hypothetical protein